MSLWISLSAFFYFYEHFSLKVFMKLDHGTSKYQKRHFCVATLYIYFWFICSAHSFHLDETFQLDQTFHVFLTNPCNLFTKQNWIKLKLKTSPPCLIIILTIPHPAQYKPQFARISYKLPGCHTQVNIYSMPFLISLLEAASATTRP